MKKKKFHRQVNLACQGLITRNNNALELANHFIPQGGLLFSQLQRYDYFRSEVDQGSFNQAGRFLIYLLPFLKAFGANDQRIGEYSTISISLTPGVRTFLDMYTSPDVYKSPCFLISAAYQPFIQAVGRVIGFGEAGIYYTPLNMDQYVLDISEKETLKDLADEITKMPPLARNLPVNEIIPITYRHRLKIIFEEEISNMKIGKIMTQIKARAGYEKVRAIIDSLEKTGNTAEGVIYLGHSILDAAALEWVRDNGGMAVSFNADRAALQFAEVAVISDNSVILAILSDTFLQKGKEGVMELVKNWDINKIQKCKIPQPFINELFSHESFPHLESVTNSNLERLIKESEYCRRTSFGETI